MLAVNGSSTRRLLVFLLSLASLSTLPVVEAAQIASWGGNRKCSVLFSERHDCGYTGITQDGCEFRKCCWRPAPDKRGIPWCFHPKEEALTEAHYTVESMQGTATGRRVMLRHRFPHLDSTAEVALMLEEHYQRDIVNIKIRSPSSVKEGQDLLASLFEPIAGYPMPSQEPCDMSQSKLQIDIVQDKFQFAVRRVEGHEDNVLFSTAARTSEDSFNSLIYKDLFIELGTVLPRDPNIYGLGERVSRFRRRPRRMAFNNRDSPALIDQNTYGAHPFYLEMRSDGRAHGVLMLTARPMEVDLGIDYLVYRILGGDIDLYFFAGPTPDDVIRQYTQVIGRPPLYNPRFLGLHQCRYGYRTLQDWIEVVKGFEETGLPLEGIWFDIDYMNRYDIFTMDPIRYPPRETKAFIEEQRQRGRMIIPIVDPGVSIRQGFPPYEKGLQSNVFLRTANSLELYTDHVWPGPVHFPDFFHPSTREYWYELLSEFKQGLIPFDGLWLDMCEPASLQPEQKPIPSHPGPKKYSLNYPPFAINSGNEELDIFQKTIDMDVLHADRKTRHIALHNAYGAALSKRTAEALEEMEPGRRHFLLVRSTFPSSGRFAAHWLGDNYSDFEHMRHSIAGLMDFQLFGIPMVGADLCGFLDASNSDLCARWMALGSFYPFARNHNAEKLENIPQEPYRWPAVAEVTKKYYALRYSLLPYWITLLRQAHDSGRPVIRPLFFEFPELLQIYRDTDEIFMLGSAILVAPVLTRAHNVDFIIPPGIWYDLLDSQRRPITKDHPEMISVHADLYTLPVFLRGGHVLVLQEPKLSIMETLASPYELLVALGRDGKATGTAYFDDGMTANPSRQQITDIIVSVESHKDHITITLRGQYGYQIVPRLNRLIILSAEPCFCTIRNVTVDQLRKSQGPLLNTMVQANRLIVEGLDLDLNQMLRVNIILTRHTQAEGLEDGTADSSTQLPDLGALGIHHQSVSLMTTDDSTS